MNRAGDGAVNRAVNGTVAPAVAPAVARVATRAVAGWRGARRNAVLGLSVAHAMVVVTGGKHHQEGGQHGLAPAAADRLRPGDHRDGPARGAYRHGRGHRGQGRGAGRTPGMARRPGHGDPGGGGGGARHHQRPCRGRGQTCRPGRRRHRRRPRLLLEDGRPGRGVQRGLRPDPALRRAAPARPAVPARTTRRPRPGPGHRPVHDRPLRRPLPPRQAQPRSGLRGVRRPARRRARCLRRRPGRRPARPRDSPAPSEGRRPRPGRAAPPPDRLVRRVGRRLPGLPPPQGQPGGGRGRDLAAARPAEETV